MAAAEPGPEAAGPPARVAAPSRLLRGCGWLLAAAALLWVAHRGLQPMDETDLFFHLKLGDFILEHHRIPFRNLFSFTFPDHPDPDLAWAFQVAVALAHRWGGFPGVVLLKAALIGAAFGLVFAAARRRGAGVGAAAAATLLALAAAEQRLVARPHLVTFVGLAALGYGLDWIAARPRRLLVLLAGVVGWANFHAGVFFAPLVVGLYAVGRALEARSVAAAGGPVTGEGAGGAAALPSGAVRGRGAWLLGGAGLAAGAALLSPGGLRLPAYLLWHTGLGSTRNVEEFRAADLANDPWFFALLFLVVLAVVLRGRRTPWRWALPILAVAPLAWRSVRFVAEWAILAGPFVAVGLSAAGRRVLALPAAGGRGARLLAPGGAGRRWGGAVLLLVAAAALVVGVVRGRRGRPLLPGLSPTVVPFDAIAFATRAGLRERLFTNLDVGCYLLWEGWPRYRVFQDARLPAYPDDFHRALDDLDRVAFQRLLRRFGVDAALLGDAGINVRADAFPPGEWALVYRGSDWRHRGAFVFARRGAGHEGVIARFEVPLRPRFRMTTGTWLEPLWEPPERTPVPRCEWYRRLAAALEAEADPQAALRAEERALAAACLGPAAEARVRFALGAERQRAGDLRGARAQYDRVLALDPNHVDALINRAYALLPEDPAAAARDFARARERTSHSSPP